MSSRAEWTKLLASNGRKATRPELLKLDDILARHEPAQGAYAVRRYGKTTEYPNLRDLAEWIAAQGLPEELVCTAYLTEQPEIVAMADELETLLAAWFPTTDTDEQVEALRAKLGRVLL